MKKNKRYLLGIGILGALVVGYLILDSLLFDGFRPREIQESGFQGRYYAHDTVTQAPAAVLLGGGQWGDYWAEQFAKKGFVGLSLPYTRQSGLPDLPEEIPLEYFERAITWLAEQPETYGRRIMVMGASKNAELALILASTFPDRIKGVIAYAPSSVSWSNTVLPYNSDELKASWTYQGKDIPYVPMDKIAGNDSSFLHTLTYWEEGLSKTEAVEQASIQVENIQGPILLFSGKDDKVWPSTRMANMVEERLKANDFTYNFEHISYEGAGHLISRHPESMSEERFGEMNVEGRPHRYAYGGTPEGDFKAKGDAKKKVFEFLESL